MNRNVPFVLCLTLLGMLAQPARAQNPEQEIQELAKRIGEQLDAIDQLLLDSSRRSQPRREPADKLKAAGAAGAEATKAIDELIDKLTQMKNQSSGGQPQDGEPQDGQQQGQPQQGQPQGQPGQGQPGSRQRRGNQTPDFVQQPQQGQPQGQPQPGQPQPGQPQQQPDPSGQHADGPQQTNDAGQNTTGNRQPEPNTGPATAGQGSGTWGELQDYVNFLKNRGSPPKVPEKFRRYYEAYLKNRRR